MQPALRKYMLIVGNGIVGFASGGKERSGHRTYQGELYALYICEAFQRSGMGRALLGKVVNHLRALGYHNMMTWVLKDNPALRFYEHVGTKKFDEKLDELDGTPLIEYAVGWVDLSAWK